MENESNNNKPAVSHEETNAVVSKEWHAFIDPLVPVAERLAGWLTTPQDSQLRHELYRHLFSQMSAGYFALIHADKEHPDFWPYLSNAYNVFLPNPDFSYYLSPLEDTGVYKISGFRGTVRRVDFQIGSGSLIPSGVDDGQNFGKTLANYDLDTVKIEKDGSFEVVLSPTRPTGYEGDWWQLHPNVTYVMVRQISYDWVNEVDGRFGIDRLDRPAIKPRPSAEKISENIKGVAGWMEATVNASAKYTKTMTANVKLNELAYFDLTYYGGVSTQQYAWGLFDLAPDEALIVEAKVPDRVRYWSICLHDELSFTIDWMHRQSSLNGYTAKVDKDGVFRAVVSAQDPGVPNWLDNAGYKIGLILARWEMCDIYPIHTVRKVKTAEVRKYLPTDTEKVTTAQRDADIRLRRKGVQMRKRW